MWENFKLKLYLETTTFNWFFDERKGHEDVVRLFEAVKAGQLGTRRTMLLMSCTRQKNLSALICLISLTSME